MSDKLSKAPTLSLDLSDFNHITRSELHYDDHIGLNNALREAQHSTHSTQVGASVNGIDSWNKDGHHAESLVVYHCARLGIRTQDATMYAPWASCLHCAQAIQAAGIQRVVVCKVLMEKTSEKWLTSVEQGLSLLYDHNIRVDVVDTEEGYFGYDIRMDGKVVKV